MTEPGTSLCPLPCVLVADCDDAWGMQLKVTFLVHYTNRPGWEHSSKLFFFKSN